MRNRAADVVADLVSAGLLDEARADQAERVVSRSLGGTPAPRGPAGTSVAAGGRAQPGTRNLLVEIAGYVGAALVLAAVALFVAQYWPEFSDAARVATLASAAVLLGAAGVVLSRVSGGRTALLTGADEVRRRLTSALLTAAALAAAFTVGLQVSLLIDRPESSWPTFAGGVVMMLLAALGYVYVPSALGTVAIAVSAFNSLMNGWTALDGQQRSAVLPGLVMIAFGVGWLYVTERGWFRERVTARALGSAIVLFGAQLPLFPGNHANLAYALTFLAALAGFGMYLRTASWPYLLAGVAAVTIVVPEAIIDWTGGALGPAGGVLVAGLTLLAASVAGFRLRKETEEPPAVESPEQEEHLVDH